MNLFPKTHGVKCPECGSKDFLVGPSNQIVYNLKCVDCGTYLLVVPSTGKVEKINPEERW